MLNYEAIKNELLLEKSELKNASEKLAGEIFNIKNKLEEKRSEDYIVDKKIKLVDSLLGLYDDIEER